MSNNLFCCLKLLRAGWLNLVPQLWEVIFKEGNYIFPELYICVLHLAFIRISIQLGKKHGLKKYKCRTYLIIKRDGNRLKSNVNINKTRVKNEAETLNKLCRLFNATWELTRAKGSFQEVYTLANAFYLLKNNYIILKSYKTW